MTRPVTDRMSTWAATHPDQLAVVAADRKRGKFRGFTYGAFEQRTRELAAGFVDLGFAGQRVVLMVTPGKGMFESGYGLMRAGAVPILIDPGLGLASVTQGLNETAPTGFVGIPTALAARTLYRWAPGATVVSAGRINKGTLSLDDVADRGRALLRGGTAIVPSLLAADEPAAIVFTSGSTGPPKGVVMTHKIFGAQVDMITAMYGLEGGMKSLSTFAPFALLGPLMGLTTYLPRMDFSKPGDVDPTRIIEMTDAFKPDLLFGSPALLDRVGRYGEATGDKLEGVNLVLSAGAPVRRHVQRRILDMVPDGTVIATPYGATEALPVATIDSAELATIDDAGICIGRPVDGVDVTIIPVIDEPVPDVNSVAKVPVGSYGEIVVKGPNVSLEYVERPLDQAMAKLAWDGEVAHRMGDLGRFDEDGRLWFGGRRSHRVRAAGQDIPAVPVEAVVDQHPAVARAALVGVGAPGEQQLIVCVELEHGQDDAVLDEILEFVVGHPEAPAVHADRVVQVLSHKGFPTDVRHNSKIDRPALAVWATKRLG